MPRRGSSRSRGGRVPRQVGPSRRQTVRGRTPQDNVRVAAAWVLERTLASLSPVGAFLGTVLERYDERDQGLLRELVFGTLRWMRRLDHVIEIAAGRPLSKIEVVLHAPLRVAAYQLLFLDRVPAHAAVHEAVEQAHALSHRGAANFVNAVLRRIARDADLSAWPVRESDPVRRLGIELSHPDLLVQRWLHTYGQAQAERLMRANNQPKPMQLLAFRHRGGREVLAEALIDEGLEIEPSTHSMVGVTVRRGNPLTTEAFRQGLLYVQDEISQVSALLPPPKPGERIFDAAAAPGGKGFALKACEPEIDLLLADVGIDRIGRLRQNLERLRLDLPVLVADAGVPPLDTQDPPFDRVVLDLPCSGTGTLRHKPELKWRLSEGEIGRLADVGLRLLEGCAPLVRPGGLLVAITCSVEAEENEEVIARFLSRYEEWNLFSLEATIPKHLETAIAGPGFWRMLPGDDHDGFTVHVMSRRATG